MPLGDLMLTFPGLAAGETDHYCRTLCLEDGTAVTRFDLQGVKSVRTTFASHPQPLGAKGCELAMTTLCPSRALPSCFDTSAGAIAYDDAPEKQGIRATTILRAATDSQLTAETGSLAVTFASWLELRLVCRSNFAVFDKDPGLSRVDHAVLAREDLAAESMDFASLMRARPSPLMAKATTTFPPTIVCAAIPRAVRTIRCPSCCTSSGGICW